MKYLIDTCVISEIVKPKPVAKVIRWLKKQDESNLFLSVLTLGELHKGVEKLSSSKRKEALQEWLSTELRERFSNKILYIDVKVAITWGEIQAKTERAGRPMTVVDALIAATGIVHHLTVVTRNGADMEQSGVALFDPWR